jgi:hypothetical protein
MRIIISAYLLFSVLCSCSTQRENTYEENIAICTKKLAHFPKGIDTTSLEGANTEAQFKEQIRECMKGSLGPSLTVKTYRGDSVSTAPMQGKAVVLFFWSATLDKDPAYIKKSDLASFAAMNALYLKYSQRVNFLGFPLNDSTTIRRHLQEHSLYFPQVYDEKISGDNYLLLTQNAGSYIIFINTQGRVVKIISGSLSTEEEAIQMYSPIIQACIENTPYSD